MGIDLRWENENGKELGAIHDPKMVMSKPVLSRDLRNTTCLRFIDPYGDTVFNQFQIPILISEIQVMLGSETDSSMLDHLQCVLDMANKSKGETHTYPKVCRRLTQGDCPTRRCSGPFPAAARGFRPLSADVIQPTKRRRL